LLLSASGLTSPTGFVAVAAAWGIVGALPPVFAALPATLRDRLSATWRNRRAF